VPADPVDVVRRLGGRASTKVLLEHTTRRRLSSPRTGRQRRLRVARSADGRAANAFESRLRAIVLDAGLADFEPQMTIELSCVRRIRVDLADRADAWSSRPTASSTTVAGRTLLGTASATTNSSPTGGRYCGSRGSTWCSDPTGWRGWWPMPSVASSPVVTPVDPDPRGTGDGAPADVGGRSARPT